MSLIARIIPVFLALMFFLGAVLIVRVPQILVWIVVVYAVLVLALGQVAVRQTLGTQTFWLLLISPFLLTLTGFFFLSILTSNPLKYLLGGVIAVIFYWFLRNVVQFAYEDQRYQPYAIENISTYANIVTVFFAASTLASLVFYLRISHFILLAASLVLFTLLILQMLWVHKIKIREHIGYLIILPIIFSQVLWATFWLPTNFFIAGMLLALSYYAATNLARHHLLGHLESFVVRRYLIIAIVGVLLTLTTAQWI